MTSEYESLTPAENEFISEEELILVTSNINHPELKFLSGIFGPLEANLPVWLPLWLAITLRKQGKCRIHPPNWLSVQALEDQIKREKVEATLQSIPSHYLEMGYMLLKHAREDIEQPDKVGALLTDLQNIRLDRLKLGIQGIADSVKNGGKVIVVHTSHISSTEIYWLKDFTTQSLQQFRLLASVSTNQSNTTDSFAETVNAGGNKKLRRFRSS